MRVVTTYEIALASCPDAVQAILLQRARGTSRARDVAPESLAWAFDYSLRCDGAIAGADFVEMLAGRRPFPERQAPRIDEGAVEGRLADRLGRLSVALVAAKGRARWSVFLGAGVVPAPVAAVERANVEREVAKDRRSAAMTPAERDRAAEAALQELRGQPGFLELRVPRPGPRR